MDLKALALPIFALLILTEVVITVVRGRNVYAWQDFGGSMSQLVHERPSETQFRYFCCRAVFFTLPIPAIRYTQRSRCNGCSHY